MNKLKSLYQIVKYRIELRKEYQGDTIFNFLECLEWWWRERPRKIKCGGCGQFIWFYGIQDSPVYCNQYCAEYREQLESENDIPF